MIDTYSTFFYGFTVDETNFKIDFNEGSVDLVAEVDTGEYTLSGVNSIATVVEAALNSEGTLNYNVSVERESRAITISANGTFSINITTGPNTFANTLKSICGFTLNKTGSDTYTSDEPAGNSFTPQFPLQSYHPTENYKKAIDVTVNKSASGVVEVYKFGDEFFMECEIMYQTNIDYSSGGLLRNDPEGVENLREFMNYLATKAPVEFMPDYSDLNIYQTFILEKTRTDKNGTGFKLFEMYGAGYRDHYRTKLLTFRLIEG